MKAAIVDVVLIAALLGGAWYLGHAHVRAEYRRETVQARTLTDLRRNIAGLIEQVEQQAEEIARLETALSIAMSDVHIVSDTITVGEIEAASKMLLTEPMLGTVKDATR